MKFKTFEAKWRQFYFGEWRNQVFFRHSPQKNEISINNRKWAYSCYTETGIVTNNRLKNEKYDYLWKVFIFVSVFQSTYDKEQFCLQFLCY